MIFPVLYCFRKPQKKRKSTFIGDFTMSYALKNNRNGEEAVYSTTVEITEKGGVLTFRFTAENSQYYCPRRGYNKIHSCGDACEIIIGSDPNREVDFEIEISPENELLVAKMRYLGIHPNNGPAKLDIQFVPEEECFVTSNVTRTPNGYIAEISLPKENILTGDGPVYFNAYRLETDGGTMEKHLFALNPTLCGRFHTPSCYLPLDEYVTKLD